MHQLSFLFMSDFDVTLAAIAQRLARHHGFKVWNLPCSTMTVDEIVGLPVIKND